MAMRGFKQIPELPKTDKEIAKAYEQDMAASQEKAQLESQVKEFKAYLETKTNTSKPFPFFVDMLKYINEGVKLTPGMEAALRKCIDRDSERDAKKENEPQAAERHITLKIKPWLMKDMGIDSRIISGVVKKETAKAYLIEGHADMIHNACWCMRCGKELTEPASQVTGFGAVCAAKMEIPYKAELLLAPASVRKAVRMQFVERLHNQKFERWIPKSRVAELVTEPTEKLQIVKAPKKSQSEARTKTAAKRAKAKAATAKRAKAKAATATKAATKRTTAKKVKKPS